jgi:hypothetical protein
MHLGYYCYYYFFYNYFVISQPHELPTTPGVPQGTVFNIFGNDASLTVKNNLVLTTHNTTTLSKAYS